MSPIQEDDFSLRPSLPRQNSQAKYRVSSRLLEIVDHFLNKKNDPMKADRALRKIVAEHGNELSPTTIHEAERMIEIFMRSYY